MKTLVLSIGNTSVFAGVGSKGKRLTTFRIPLAAASSARAIVRKISLRVRGKIERAVLCSVVPRLTPAIEREIKTRFGTSPRRLTAENLPGLKIAYRDPGELGTDRIAAALGAREIYGARNVIVVDCGTATTVTALRGDGVILGGAIFPGLGLWSGMLASRTAQLPEVPLRRPRAVVGRSPRESLQSGIFHGHAGAIRELVRRIRLEAFGRGEAIVVGTGGNAPLFSNEALFSHAVPNLVLIGLERFGRMAAD